MLRVLVVNIIITIVITIVIIVITIITIITIIITITIGIITIIISPPTLIEQGCELPAGAPVETCPCRSSGRSTRALSWLTSGRV